MITTNSASIFERLERYIPGGVNSPVRTGCGLVKTPIIAREAKGSSFIDADGNEFLDFCGSWGALILGHADEEVLERVWKRMQKGTSFGLTTEVEAELAEAICSRLPHVEKVRCVSSGTEATMSALRLARGYTGRDVIIKFNGNYHGHADYLLVAAGSGVAEINATSTSAGVPQECIKHTISLPYNDPESARKALRSHNVAAVILEPIAGNMGCVPATEEFLQTLREECTATGALLIVDEVITGFRVGPQGAQGLYGITGDLSCFGKIIGGGFPVGAFGGRAKIMDRLAPLGDVYQAGTLSGNPIAMEAGLTALERTSAPDFYEKLEKKSAELADGLSSETLSVQRVGSMLSLFFGVEKFRRMEDSAKLDKEKFNSFFRHMISHGIYIPPSPFESWFVSEAHTEEEIQRARETIASFL